MRDVLEVITSGQELDLRRFAGASAEKIVALQNDGELDDYTYRVAGCVGEFWTKMCRAHVFPEAAVDEKMLLANGVRFGKGLQLVNILRDVPVDLRNGRCYLPAEELAAAGLSPADLLEPKNEAKFRPLYNRYLALAEGHLAAGWAYTNALPRRLFPGETGLRVAGVDRGKNAGQIARRQRAGPGAAHQGQPPGGEEIDHEIGALLPVAGQMAADGGTAAGVRRGFLAKTAGFR